MRILNLVSVVALLFSVAQADASVQSSSYLDIDNFVVDVTAGTPVAVLAPEESSTLVTVLNGTPAVGGSNTSVGANVVYNGGVVPAGLENLMDHAAVGALLADPFAVADSFGDGGSILSAGGAQATSFSTVGAANVPIVADEGFATTTEVVNVQSIFTATELVFTFSFDAVLELFLENGDPSGVLGASSGFNVNINTVGVDFDVAGEGATNDYIFEPLELNASIGSKTDGDSTLSVSDSFVSPVITIPAFTTFSFEIRQSTGATLSPVPEPTTLMVWGILGVCGAAATRRRRA